MSRARFDSNKSCVTRATILSTNFAKKKALVENDSQAKRRQKAGKPKNAQKRPFLACRKRGRRENCRIRHNRQTSIGFYIFI